MVIMLIMSDFRHLDMFLLDVQQMAEPISKKEQQEKNIS